MRVRLRQIVPVADYVLLGPCYRAIDGMNNSRYQVSLSHEVATQPHSATMLSHILVMQTTNRWRAPIVAKYNGTTFLPTASMHSELNMGYRPPYGYDHTVNHTVNAVKG